MASMRPLWSWSTCWAVVVEGLPERLAEGAAMGTPASRMISRVTSVLGQRMATVERPLLWFFPGDAGIGRQYHGEGPRPKPLRQEICHIRNMVTEQGQLLRPCDM